MSSKAVQLPKGVVLKVPEGDQGTTNAIPLLLEMGAPAQFVHRKLGQKVERQGTFEIENTIERYLHIVDCDSLAGSTSAASQRSQQRQVKVKVEEQSESVQNYLAVLQGARDHLMADPVLLENVFVTPDVICWPPPVVLKPLINMRAALLSAAGEISDARRLQEALLRHTVEIVGSGTHVMTEEKFTGSTPVCYTVETEKVDRHVPTKGAVEVKADSLIPGGQPPKKKKKAAVVAARKQEKAAWHHSLQGDGTSVKEEYKGNVGVVTRRYKKDMLSCLGEEEDLLLTLSPTQTIASILSVEFKHSEYRFKDLLGAVLGLNMGDGGTEGSRWALNKSVMQQFKEMAGIGWVDLIRLHSAIYERELRSIFGGETGDSDPFKSPTAAKHAMTSANGALYAIDDFMRFERDGSLTNLGMMKLLAQNSHQRLRLRNGVYATKVTFSRFFVVFKNTALADEGGKDEENGNKKKKKDEHKLTADELRQFEINFKIQGSVEAETERNGNVKIIYNHSTADSPRNTTAKMAQNDPLAATHLTPQEEAVEKYLDGLAGKAHLVFHRQAQLSPCCLANEYLSSGPKPQGPFVPGQDFVVVHGPRMVDNFAPFVDLQNKMDDMFEEATLDPKSRGQIMRSIREFGDIQAEKRKAELKIVTDDHVEGLLTGLFAQHGGRIALAHAKRDAGLRGVPSKQLYIVLKRMGHFDTRAKQWVKH